MKKLRILYSVSLLALAGFIFSKIIGYVYRFVITQLGTESYGEFTLALSVFSISLFISILGLDNGLLRFLSKYHAKKNFKNAKKIILCTINIALISSIAIGLLLYISADEIGKLFQSQKIGEILKILSISTPFAALGLIFIEGLKAIEKPRIAIISQYFIERIFLLTLTFSVISIGLGLIGITFAYISASFLTFLISGIYIFNYIRKKRKSSTNSNLYLPLLKYSLPLMLSGSIYMIMRWADVMMVGYFHGPSLAGIYDVACLLSLTLFILPEALLYNFIPKMIKLKTQKKHKQFFELLKKSRNYIFLSNLLVIFMLIFFPEPAIKHFLGKDYLAATAPLIILSMGVFIRSFLLPYTKTLLVFGFSNFVLYGTTAAVLFNIIFNLILIPKYELIGAAISTSLSYTILGVISLIFYKKIKNYKSQNSPTLDKPLQ